MPRDPTRDPNSAHPVSTDPGTADAGTVDPGTSASASSASSETAQQTLGPVLVVLGPTAVGKSSLAMRLARELGGEIVNADALQVYRGLELGTDKPTPEMRSEIRHHLVDILDPEEPYSAGDFARRARAAIRDAESRGRVPLVVGGSGLYLKALLEGLSPLPRRDEEIRSALKQRVREEGVETLHAELAKVDPATAEKVAPRDRQRIVRALEVHAIAGRPMSAMMQEKSPDFVPVEAVRLGLTLPRAILYDRIADRIRDMVEKGWVEEVSALLDHGVEPSVPAFQAIGYSQIVQHILGTLSLEQAIEDTVIATRRYAKRQVTWFRRVEGIRWIPALEIEHRFPILLREITLGGVFAR